MAEARAQRVVTAVVGAFLCAFVLAEVNYPILAPQTELAVFALAGLVLCFTLFPARRRSPSADRAGSERGRAGWLLDGVLVLASCLTFGHVIAHSEPAFSSWWVGGQSLGNRAGQETAADIAVGVAGLVLVLEATRRTVGWTLPLLTAAFLSYAWAGAWLPGWLLPHRGYGVERIVSQSFLHSQGVFGVALNVMFTYVFLFVLFGAFLERTGATTFIIEVARRAFRSSAGAPAKIAVLSSGLMGSLSGSAVANTATTGTFTIPMMRSSGFPPTLAAGVEAAASTGGALVPPVMGAGAYMMLEIVDPPVTYLQIIRAALIPAVLYYLSIFLIVHFQARRSHIARRAEDTSGASGGRLRAAEGVVFGTAFAALLLFLILGYTAFRAASLALGAALLVSLLSRRTRPNGSALAAIAAKTARDAVPLVAAAACVGIILGVVTLTGIGTRFPALLLPLAEESLLLALIALMLSSLVLGMGLPSAVCYLLLATLVGPVLGDLGVVPLAAHLFIFYFGMMSMVTPPVALAAYAAASIAGSEIMRTGFAAFRIALVGFLLPFLFVMRPQILMLAADGTPASIGSIAPAVTVALCGIVPFAAAIAGRLFSDLGFVSRLLLLLAAVLLLLPSLRVPVGSLSVPIMDVFGIALFGGIAVRDWAGHRRPAPAPSRS